MLYKTQNLTFKQPHWSLNFHALFMKNVLFKQKKDKIMKLKAFCGKQTETVQHVLKMR